MMATGVAGIFGPQSEDTAEHVQSVCDTMEIPHIEMRWDLSQRRGACAVNLFPHPSVLARVRHILLTQKVVCANIWRKSVLLVSAFFAF
jgi:hypothetical protein